MRYWLCRCLLTLLICLSGLPVWAVETLQTPEAYLSQGQRVMRQGHFVQALELYQRGIELAEAERPVDRKRLGLLYGSIGQAHQRLGRYQLGLEAFQTALTHFSALGDLEGEAWCLLSLGQIESLMAQYDLALNHYEAAFERYQRAGNQAFALTASNHIGMTYYQRKDYPQALTVFEQNLAAFRQLGLEPSIGPALSVLIGVYNELGRFDDALAAGRESLERFSGPAFAESRAVVLAALGDTYLGRERLDLALSHYQQALSLQQQFGQRISEAATRKSIAFVHVRLNRYHDALAQYRETTAIYEQLRAQVGGPFRQDFLAAQIQSYQGLLAMHALKQDWPEVLVAFELSHARRLSELLGGLSLPADGSPPELAPDTAALLYANTDRQRMASLYLVSQQLLGKLWDTRLLTASPDEALQPQPDWEAFLADVLPSVLPQVRKQSLEGLIQRYRSLLNQPDDNHRKQRVAMAQKLYQFLIQPWEAQLAGKKRLIIVPEGILGYLPFETLIDAEGRYLAERFEITYSPSLTSLHQLRARGESQASQPLLLLGDPVYETASAQMTPVESDEQLRQLRQQVAMVPDQPMRDIYDSLGAFSWDPLPGTRQEAQGIVASLPGAELLMGPEASEDRLKALSSSGELARYRVLHFATHGLTLSELPELSALVLSQFSSARGSEDGYLRAPEIAAMKLDAEFVSLSACETGLGKVLAGEGIVGLTQAFLVAGARGVLASLWQIDDQGSAEFMRALYAEAAQNGGNYKQALQTVRQGFIRGDYGESYRSPYYWAPFVYYGR